MQHDSSRHVWRACGIVAALALAGCEGPPVAPHSQELIAALEHGEWSDVVILSQPTRVQIGDATVSGTVSARLTTKPNNPGGWLKIEYDDPAADGRRTSWDTEIVALSLSGDHPLVFELEGVATIRRRGERRPESFPIQGTARQDPEAPDCIIFDLVGSGVHPIMFEVEARIRIR